MKWLNSVKSRPRCEMRELVWVSVLMSLLLIAAL